jgi:hypothetical protein
MYRLTKRLDILATGLLTLSTNNGHPIHQTPPVVDGHLNVAFGFDYEENQDFYILTLILE